MSRVVIIGGGAAGLLAGISAAQNGAQVTILEKMRQPGKKMLITGKGRCNITNAGELAEIIKNIPGNGRFLNSALHRFTNDDIVDMLESNGLATKVERGNRVFPVSDKAADVVDAMVLQLHELGVKLITDARVTEILTEDMEASGSDGLEKAGQMEDSHSQRAVGVKLADGREYQGHSVIVATGGMSYPSTGSTGDGSRWAVRLGHRVVKQLPALVPLETEDEWAKELQGLALKNVRAALLSEGEKISDMFGEMLFTHFGVSGPIVLSLSRQAAQELDKGRFVELELDLKPALTMEQLDARLLRDFEKYQNKEIKNGMRDLLPGRLIEPVLDAAYLKPDRPVHTITREERRKLAEVLKCLPMIISGTRPIAEAIVTAGGVDVKEIDPKTMESKLVKGLYFAGETLDIDGYTGGYNLQAAFSMGAAAGNWSVWNN